MQKAILYASLFLFVISCEDKDEDLVTPDPEPACKITKIIQGTNNGASPDTTYTFFYDASGKLTKINRIQPQYSSNYDNIVSYDGSGRLSSVVTSDNYRGNFYKYTSGGKLDEIIYLSGLDSTKFRFIYGADTLPEKCIQIKVSSKDTSEYRYTYQNGNIVTKEFISKGLTSTKHYFEYTNIPNMSKELILLGHFNVVAIGYFDEFLFFNKNVMKKATLFNSAYYINYQLDSGKVVQTVTCWLKSPAFTDTTQRDTRNFFYECQ